MTPTDALKAAISQLSFRAAEQRPRTFNPYPVTTTKLLPTKRLTTIPVLRQHNYWQIGDAKMSMERTIEAGHLTPHITLSLRDYERLSALVTTVMISAPELAEILAGELARAHVLAAGRCPQNIVSMNSDVTFRDDRTGRVQSMRLLYPSESDVANGRLSVLTPVGAALIGVRAGESITWATPAGELRPLTVLAVQDP